MASKIDLYTQAWCDVVFADKNREYGAYEMRKLSGRRHLTAFVVVIAVSVFALVLPTIIESVIPKKKEMMTEVTSLANLEVEAAKPKEEVMKNFTPPPPPLKSTIKFTPPVIKKDEEVKEEDEIKTQEQLNETNLSISVKDVQGTDEEAGLDIAELEERKEIVEESSGEKPYTFVEQMPEFPGGEDEMRKYLNKNVVYPAVAQENGISGTVFVAFVVGPDGTITRAKVLRGFDKACEEEAMRVITKMPSWKPGRQNGKPVFVQYTVPIKFTLHN